MIFTDTITTVELAENQTANWVIVDARVDLALPAWGAEEYRKAHIPRAVFADLNRQLASPPTPNSGRHPLPPVDDFLRQVAAWGIDAEKQVVIYDSLNGAFAARLWWMINAIGVHRVAILEGGIAHWLSEGRPTVSGEESNLPGNPMSVAGYNPSMFVTTREVEYGLRENNLLLIDARSPERYRGELEPIDPIAGHIPGAVNRFHGLNLNSNGLFKSAAELRTEFNQLLGNKIYPEDVVVYCGSGVTSIHHIIAMQKAGLPGARLYVGSWSEWIRDPHRPIALGDTSSPK
jgi:thiosulfate/3-mercaptopyruvate sulfurtransferase